jgi:hypothetical protein
MGRVGKTAFQAGTWQKPSFHAPCETGEVSAEDKTWLSKYTNMDNGQRGIWWVVARRNQKFVDNTIMVRQARQMGRAPTLVELYSTHAHKKRVTVQTAEVQR